MPKLDRLLALLACICMGVVLTGCEFKKPDYRRDYSLQITTTISSDGKLVAVLERAGTPAPRLHLRWVDTDGPWVEKPVPVFTNNIQFALHGYELLLAHHQPDNLDIGRVTRWDVSDPQKEPQRLFQGPFFTAPIEVKPGEYLVRTCEPTGMDFDQRDKNTCQTRNLGAYWVLLKPLTEPIAVTPKELTARYTQPNVTDFGFFWIHNYVVGHGPYAEEQQPTTHPMLLSFPLPGGKAPEFEVKHLSRESKVFCDRRIQRCIRRYIAGTDPSTKLYIFDHELMYQGGTCHAKGLQGYADGSSMTPDGRAAVIPVANTADERRRVVVLKFKDGQCEPTSVQHLHFEER